MKFNLLSSACGAALLAAATPAFADSTFSGVVQLEYGSGTNNSSYFGLSGQLGDPNYINGKAKGYWPLSQEIHLQVDLFVDHSQDIAADGGEWGNSGDATTYGGTVHLLHPFENRARLGVAGSLWNDDIYLPADDGKFDKTMGLAAIEGQFFGSDWTLTGQAGVLATIECSDSCGGSLKDGTFVRGKIKYFLHDNTALSLEALQLWGGLDDDDASVFNGKSTSHTKWKFEAEHRFESSQFAGTLGLSHETNEANVGLPISADIDTVWLGVKFYYNQPSLKAHDRSGAELDTPDFGDLPESEGILSYLYGGP
jgi:hypothetical protein